MSAIDTNYGCFPNVGISFSYECTLHIFGFLPPQVLGLVSRVSKGWNRAASDNMLWKAHVNEYFPSYSYQGQGTWKDIWVRLCSVNYIRIGAVNNDMFSWSTSRIIRYQENETTVVHWNVGEPFKNRLPIREVMLSNYIIKDIENGRAVANDFTTNLMYIFCKGQPTKKASATPQPNEFFIHGNKILCVYDNLPLTLISILDIDTLTPLRTLSLPALRMGRSLLQDNKLIVAQNLMNPLTHEHEEIIQVWDIDQGVLLHTLHGHKHPPYFFKLCKDLLVSTDLATVDKKHECTLKLWDIQADRCLLTIPLDKASPMIAHRCCDFNGHFIVFNEGKVIKVWDAIHLKELYSCDKHETAVTALLLDGDFLFSGDDNGIVNIWDVKTGDLMRTIKEEGNLRGGQLYKGIEWFHREEDKLYIFGTQLFTLELKKIASA